MAYNSDQYKYLLMKRLQKHFTMKYAEDRVYTRNFFGKLFDDDIIVTEESYNDFMLAMDDELNYCFNNNIYECEDISEEDITVNQQPLINAFAALGIDLVLEHGDPGYCTFTKPDGTVMVYTVGSSTNYFYVNAQSGIEYSYAKAMMPYYEFEDCKGLELTEELSHSTGNNTWWTYDDINNMMRINGEGTFICIPDLTDFNNEQYSTIIVGTGVNEIYNSALSNSCVKQLILLHNADADLTTITGDVTIQDSWTMDIYCDHPALQNATNLPGGVFITWHPLNDWDGNAPTVINEGLYYNGIFLPRFKHKSYTDFLIGTSSDGSYYLRTGSTTIASGSTTITGGRYKFNEENWSWDYQSSTVSITPIWSNYDLLVKNSTTIYLKGTEPKTTP